MRRADTEGENPAPSLIYLNNAAEGWPKAPGVAASVAEALVNPPSSPGRGGELWTDPAADCRQRIATLLGAPDPRRIVLTANATHALNLAIQGLSLRANAIVVTTVTEHNSVLRPLFHLQRDIGAQIVLIGLNASGALDLTAYEQALSKRPALVAISHASNVTGRINDVERLFGLAKDAGATTLLDASQTVAHVPVLPLRYGADLVAFPGQKGLHGPAGTGAMYVAPHLDLEQILVGGTGHHSASRLHPVEMPERLEAGTPNGPALAGLAAALAWHAANGGEFRQRCEQAGHQLRAGLRSIAGVTLFDDEPGPRRLGLVSFQIDGWPVEEVAFVLRESFGIACRVGLHCAPLIHAAIGSPPEGTVRLSASGFSSNADIQAAVSAVARLAA